MFLKTEAKLRTINVELLNFIAAFAKGLGSRLNV